MSFIEINRRCDECEKTRAALAELQRRVDNFELDYQNLYEKVRTNLAKLSKRARMADNGETDPQEGDPLAQFRKQLIERKLGRKGA